MSFALVSAVIVVSALFVVRAKNLIHAVLWLAVTLLGTAGLYAQLNAPFLAGVQVLTYVGGVVTLMIFGIMVTRRHEGVEAPAGTDSDEKGFIFAAALFVVLALAIWKSPLPATAAAPATTGQLAHALLDQYLIAFEALSLLLLGAIVGAIVLARRRDPDPVTGEEPAAAAPTRTTEVAP